jgi:hypothetical protein
MLDGDIERESQLNLLYNGTEAHCINELRMRKLAFHNMCAHIRSCGLLVDTLHFFFCGEVDTLHVTVEEQVAMFIHSKKKLQHLFMLWGILV